MITRNIVTEYAVRLPILAAMPSGKRNVIVLQISSGGSSLGFDSKATLVPVESMTAIVANRSAANRFTNRILNSLKMTDVTISEMMETMFNTTAVIEMSRRNMCTPKRLCTSALLKAVLFSCVQLLEKKELGHSSIAEVTSSVVLASQHLFNLLLPGHLIPESVAIPISCLKLLKVAIVLFFVALPFPSVYVAVTYLWSGIVKVMVM